MLVRCSRHQQGSCTHLSTQQCIAPDKSAIGRGVFSAVWVMAEERGRLLSLPIPGLPNLALHGYPPIVWCQIRGGTRFPYSNRLMRKNGLLAED